MKLVIINGSPRNKKSNSKLLIDEFLKGYGSIHKENIFVHFLANQKMKNEVIRDYQDADCVILIFPLYTDCMPGMVKEFIEDIVDLKNLKPKKMGFIVQSGFPEAIHSEAVEQYLEKLSKRLEVACLGTIIKGGIEGIQIMPPFMTNKLYKQFRKLGSYFAQNQTFSPELSKKLRTPYKMSSFRILVFKLLMKTGLTNSYWNNNLKKNGAYEIRFDKPYEIKLSEV